MNSRSRPTGSDRNYAIGHSGGLQGNATSPRANIDNHLLIQRGDARDFGEVPPVKWQPVVAIRALVVYKQVGDRPYNHVLGVCQVALVDRWTMMSLHIVQEASRRTDSSF